MARRKVIERLFEDWEQQILRPVAVSLSTALILFAASLSFSPVRSFLFPPPVVADYPLICTAEPFLDNANHVLVDFFIVNRTGNPYSREELASLLRIRHQGQTPQPSPDIILRHSRYENGKPKGKVERVLFDEAFNKGKGELRYDLRDDAVSIQVDRIEQRAIMKLTLALAPFDFDPSIFVRTAKYFVPFDFRQYEDACYTRRE